MRNYEYVPLKSDEATIRVLVLFPGKFKEKIQVALKTIVLRPKESEYFYEALSYAWALRVRRSLYGSSRGRIMSRVPSPLGP